MELSNGAGEEGGEVATAVGCPSDKAEVGKADICQGCPGRQQCLAQCGVDSDQKFIDARMGAVKRKIVVLSGKGGVGKSSIASTLSMALAKLSAEVGVVDLDICGPSIPKLLAVEGEKVVDSPYGWIPLSSPHGGIKVMSVANLLEERDSAVVWRGPRKTAIIKRFVKDTFWGRLDYLIFDTPPGTSDEHLSVVKVLVNARPEGAILVTSPQEVALATVLREIDFCRKMKLKIMGIVENMSGFQCPCCKECWPIFSETEGGVSRLAEEYGIPVLGSVPIDPVLVRCCEEGGDIFLSHSDSPAATAIMNIATSIHNNTYSNKH